MSHHCFTGFILGKKSSDEKTNAETSYCWEANAKFQNLTLWNHDSLPSNDDAFMRTFHWFAVAKAVSSYLTYAVLRHLMDLILAYFNFIEYNLFIRRPCECPCFILLRNLCALYWFSEIIIWTTASSLKHGLIFWCKYFS